VTKPPSDLVAERHLYNDATNQIATELDVLHQQLNTVASPEQRDWLTRLAARLRAIGRDPADPVPAVVDPRDRASTTPVPTPIHSDGRVVGP